MRWPSLISSQPYVLQNLNDEWRIISELVPLSTEVSRRSEFWGCLKPEKLSPLYTGSNCDQCTGQIYGPRFMCGHSSCIRTLCWSCMADPEIEHHSKDPFIRLDYGDQFLKKTRYVCQTAAEAANITADKEPSSSKLNEQTSGSKGLRGSLRHIASTYFPHSRSSSSSNFKVPETPAKHDEISSSHQKVVALTSEAIYEVS